MRRPEALAAVEDLQGVVEEEMDIDPRAGITAAAGAGGELQCALAELERVVVGDGAAVFEAADAGEVGGRRAPGRFGLRRRLGEAGVVAWTEAVEDPLGLGAGTGVGEAEFDDEAILERAKEAFHPALALCREGGDPADAEFLEGAADLGGGDGARELLREALGRLRLAMKDAMAIGVGGGGDAIVPDEVAEQEEIAVGVFLGAKDAAEDFAGGIVNGGVEDEAGAAVLQPGVVAAVHLDEQPGLRHPLASPAMLGGAAAARARNPRVAQEALHGRARHRHSFVLAQELGEVVIIDARIPRTGQREDPQSDRLREAPWRRAASVAMRERGEAVLADLGQQATAMAARAAEEPRRVRRCEAPLENLTQYVSSLLLPHAQEYVPPVHTPRVTESLSC